MSHAERNVCLSHFVAKISSSQSPIRGCTKRGYLNSLMRAMKMFESQNMLTAQYGEDWSWRTSLHYKKLRCVLARTTIRNEIALCPNPKTTAAAHMSEEQFNTLHNYTLELSNSSENFHEKLTHCIRYFAQGLLMFACLRGRDELALCQVDEFTIIDEATISFQMRRDYKSHKLDAQYKVTHKPPRILLGSQYVTLL
jgi:hypothetical protein